jgi:hypothetical protein
MKSVKVEFIDSNNRKFVFTIYPDTVHIQEVLFDNGRIGYFEPVKWILEPWKKKSTPPKWMITCDEAMEYLRKVLINGAFI